MDQKYIVAAIRTWEGVEVNWALVVQQRVNEEIQTHKAQSPIVYWRIQRRTLGREDTKV